MLMTKGCVYYLYHMLLTLHKSTMIFGGKPYCYNYLFTTVNINKPLHHQHSLFMLIKLYCTLVKLRHARLMLNCPTR